MENRNNLLIELSLKHMTYTEKNKRINFARVFKDYQLIYNDIDNQQDLREVIYSLHTKEEYENMKYSERQASEKELVHNSTRYKEINTDEKLSPDEVLELHGLDSTLNELISAGSTRSKIGTKGNDEGYFINTYNNIRYKPREFKLSKELLKEMWKSMQIEPFTVKELNLDGKGLLLISLNDVHIWRNTYETYKLHIQEIITVIKSRKWKQIIIKQGGDWFHSNNSQGTTVAGTQVAYEVSKTQLFAEGSKIMYPILTASLENSINVKYVYIEGNHDKDMAWSFAWGLKNLYPQIEFDIEEEVYKKHTYNNVLLLMTHGDKPRNLNTLGKVMFERYRKEMAKAETVEIHTEHVHHEKVKDDMGIVFRTNPTASKTDKYHYEGGFIGARKIFQCFAYNDYELKNTYNITGRY